MPVIKRRRHAAFHLLSRFHRPPTTPVLKKRTTVSRSPFGHFSLPHLSRPKHLALPHLLPWAPFLIGLLFWFILVISPVFRIRHITCYYGSAPCPPEIMAELNRFIHQSLLTFYPQPLIQKLLTTYPDIKAVHLDRQLPDQLQANLEIESNLTLIKIATNSAALIVGNNQQVIDQVIHPDPNLPYILYPQATTLRVNQTISQAELLFAIQLSQLLFQQQITFQSIEIVTPQTLIIVLNPDLQIIFSSQVDLHRQVTTLQLILAKSTMLQDYPLVDLRFDEPVLKRYLNASPSASIDAL